MEEERKAQEHIIVSGPPGTVEARDCTWFAFIYFCESLVCHLRLLLRLKEILQPRRVFDHGYASNGTDPGRW